MALPVTLALGYARAANDPGVGSPIEWMLKVPSRTRGAIGKPSLRDGLRRRVSIQSDRRTAMRTGSLTGTESKSTCRVFDHVAGVIFRTSAFRTPTASSVSAFRCGETLRSACPDIRGCPGGFVRDTSSIGRSSLQFEKWCRKQNLPPTLSMGEPEISHCGRRDDRNGFVCAHPSTGSERHHRKPHSSTASPFANQ